MLLLVSFASYTAALYETSSISYVLPSAGCDLNLTLNQKGILNAVTYAGRIERMDENTVQLRRCVLLAGMMISAIPWGYLSDKLGRRKLLIYGNLLGSICVFMCAVSPNVWSLVVFKFLGGLM